MCGVWLAVAHLVGALPADDPARYRRRLRILLPSAAGPTAAACFTWLIRGAMGSVVMVFVVGPSLVAVALAFVRANQLANRLVNERSKP